MSLIENTFLFVKQKLQNAEAGHDWYHVERVYKNAILMFKLYAKILAIVVVGMSNLT